MGGKLDCNLSDLAESESKEWLITNGIGGYGSGTVSGLLTRRYHGLLIAALEYPLQKTLLLSKLNETVSYGEEQYELYCDRWTNDSICPAGYKYIHNFFLVGTTPVWQYKVANALFEKRIWMEQGENTTYIRYTLLHGEFPLELSLQALVNYRDCHGDTHSSNWEMKVDSIAGGITVQPDLNSQNRLYIFSDRSAEGSNHWQPEHIWYHNYSLAKEKYRGLVHCEDHLLAATSKATLYEKDSITIVASTEPTPDLDGEFAWKRQYKHEQNLLNKSQRIVFGANNHSAVPPQWIGQLVLAANQFIVDCQTSRGHCNTKFFQNGKTIIAGYPWFDDRSRDTMISLPGLALAIGRPRVARFILRAYVEYLSEGMLPNLLINSQKKAEYTNVDASLWYFEAIYAYYRNTLDKSLAKELFPVLAEIIASYTKGTRHNIHQDIDGLLYAGTSEHSLTWMDAQVEKLAVTPRTGKTIEINALWYNALIIMEQLAIELELPPIKYTQQANLVRQGFQKF